MSQYIAIGAGLFASLLAVGMLVGKFLSRRSPLDENEQDDKAKKED